MSNLKKIEIGLLSKWIKFPEFGVKKIQNELNNTKAPQFVLMDNNFIISDIKKDKYWTIFSCYYIESNEMFYFRLTRRNDNSDLILYPKYLKNFISIV